jgi:hypothetical protein
MPLSVPSPHHTQRYVSLEDEDYEEEDGADEDTHFLQVMTPNTEELDFIGSGDKSKSKRGRKIKYLNSICLECEEKGSSSKGGIWCYETQSHSNKKRAPKYIVCTQCKKMVSGPKFTRHYSKCHQKITGKPIVGTTASGTQNSDNENNLSFNEEDGVASEQLYFFTANNQNSSNTDTETRPDKLSTQIQYHQFNAQYGQQPPPQKQLPKILPSNNRQFTQFGTSPSPNTQQKSSGSGSVVAPNGLSFVIQTMPFTRSFHTSEVKENTNGQVQFTNETENFNIPYSQPTTKSTSINFIHTNPSTTNTYQQAQSSQQQQQQLPTTQPPTTQQNQSQQHQQQQQPHPMLQQQTVIAPTTWHNYTFNSDNQLSYDNHATVFNHRHTFIPNQQSSTTQQSQQTVFHGDLMNVNPISSSNNINATPIPTTAASPSLTATTQPNKKRRYSRINATGLTTESVVMPITHDVQPAIVEVRDDHSIKQFLQDTSDDIYSLRLYNETRNEYVVLLTTQHKPVSELCSSKKRKKLNQIVAPALGKFGIGADQLLNINDVRKVLKAKQTRDQPLFDANSSRSDDSTPTSPENDIRNDEIFDNSPPRQENVMGFTFSNNLLNTSGEAVQDEKMRPNVTEPHTPGSSNLAWLQHDTPRSSQNTASLLGMSFNMLTDEYNKDSEAIIEKLTSPNVTSNNGSASLIVPPHDKAL